MWIRSQKSDAFVFINLGLPALVILCLWFAAKTFGLVEDIFLPSPFAVWEAGVQQFFHGDILRHVQWSLIRLAASTIVAILIALPLSLCLVLFESVNRLLRSILLAMRYVPVVAFIPLSMKLIGLNEVQKITIVAYGSILILLPSITTAIADVETTFLDLGFCNGLSKFQVMTSILLRRAMPRIYDGIRASVGLAWNYLLIAELLGAEYGLGQVIARASRYIQMDLVFLAIIIIFVLGVVIDLAFEYFRHLLFPWTVSTTVGFQGTSSNSIPSVPTIAIDGSTRHRLRAEDETRLGILKVDKISKSYSDFRRRKTTVISEMTFQVARGETLVILGPSGCGKTTILRIMAGLLAGDSGEVSIGAIPVKGPDDRVGMVVQGNNCLPWFTVKQNIELPLWNQRKSASESDDGKRVHEAIAKYRLDDKCNEFPSSLSGGQIQKVALARMEVGGKGVWLLDEPMSSIDLAQREEFRTMIMSTIKQRHITSVWVTHDIDEAIDVGDRIFVLSESPVSVIANISNISLRRGDDSERLAIKRQIISSLR